MDIEVLVKEDGEEITWKKKRRNDARTDRRRDKLINGEINKEGRTEKRLGRKGLIHDLVIIIMTKKEGKNVGGEEIYDEN